MTQKKKWQKILINILTLFILGLIFTLLLIPSAMINEIGHRHVDVQVRDPKDYNVSAKSLTLETTDQLKLAAWHVQAKIPTKGTVILLSGIQTPSVTDFFGYAKMLTDYGYDSLLIEMRGHGASEGDYISLGMKEWLDVKAGVDFIQTNTSLKELPIIVWGTSMGGAAALTSLDKIPEIDGVISCSAYSSWTDVFAERMVLSGLPRWFATLDKPFCNAYLAFTYGINNLKVTPLNALKNLDNRPVLLMHSTKDSQVPYANFRRLLDIAPSNNVKTFIREGDEHFICHADAAMNPRLDEAFSQTVLNFLNTYF